MAKTPRRLIALALLLVLLLAGWLAAGPYLAIRGIQRALEARDVSRLAPHVDYPALRGSIKAQVEDRIARGMAGRFGDSAAGAMAGSLAGMLSDSAVEAMVSPVGIAILLQGHALKQRATGELEPDGGIGAAPLPYDPLANARTRFESPARFVATVDSADGKPVAFVFQLQGLRWRLTDIRLPPAG